ncbi:hypothetical protein ABPG77_000550 [Micractinium sp. CCAP 211/92]
MGAGRMRNVAQRPTTRAVMMAMVGALAVLAVQSALPAGTPGELLASVGIPMPATLLASAGAAAVRAGEGLDSLDPARQVFADFVAAHRGQLELLWQGRTEGIRERGIVIAAGKPGTLANAFASLYVLRHTLKSDLPVTIMYWGRVAGDVPTDETIAFMKMHISDLHFVDASALPWPAWHRPLSKDLDSWKQTDGWKFKAFVLYAAPYKHAMFLDSDATPAMDPAALFDHPIFHSTGSMFWQELWCGDCDLFRQLGMPSIGRERQTESGIILVDRQRHWLMLEWALWLNTNDHITYKLAYGDKDTFRAAFYLAGTLSDFFQMEYPLGLMLQEKEGGFWNRGYLQPHPNGSAMFVHRVAAAKFELGSDDPKPITHVTVPSCKYFGEKGWNSELIPRDHFQDKVFVESKAGVCPFSMHTLYDAARRCGKYDWDEAEGGQQLPVFEIAQKGHVGRAISGAADAFLLLRSEMKERGKDSLLFQLDGAHG